MATALLPNIWAGYGSSGRSASTRSNSTFLKLFTPPPNTKSSQYAANVAALQKGHKGGGGGLLGGIENFASNLAHDVTTTAKGLGVSAAGAIEHPISTVEHLPKTAEAIAQDYKTRYKDLFTGNFGKFAHEVEAHPLGYMLDAGTLLTGGLGAAAKVGLIRVPAEGAALRLTRVGADTSANPARRYFSSSPTKAAKEVLWTHLQKNVLPHNVPIIGEGAAATRILSNRAQYEAALTKAPELMYRRATKALKSPEQHTTLDLLLRRTTPKQELAMLKGVHGKDIPQEAIDRLSNPKITTMYHNINANAKYGESAAKLTKEEQQIRNAYDASIAMGQHQANILGIDAAEAMDRAVLHHHVMDAVKAGKVMTRGAGKEKTHFLPESYMKNPMRSTAEITNSLKKSGLAPGYVPDVSVLGAGVKAQAHSEAINFLEGIRHPHARNLLNTHIQASAIASAERARQLLHGAAQQVPHLPKGWAYLSEDIHKPFLGVAKETMPKEVQAMAEQAAQHGNVADSNGRMFNMLQHEYGVPSHQLALPKKLIQEIQGQRAREMGTLSSGLGKANRAWKDLVLAMRPGFVVNNVVGNQAMFHLRHGLGAGAMKLAHNPEIRRMYENILPEAAQSNYWRHDMGGELETFHNDLLPASTKGKLAAARSGFYQLVGHHEDWLARTTMLDHAKKIPAIQDRLKQLKGGAFKGADYQHPLAQAIHDTVNGFTDKAGQFHPGQDAVRQELLRAVDDVRGNYRHYNAFERGLRQIVPFYGWDRHAIRFYTRLLSDRPALASLLTTIGARGYAANQHEFSGAPDFMSTYSGINLPFMHVKGKTQVIDTRSLNPLATVGDTMQALGEIAGHGKSGEMPNTAGLLNPFLVGIGAGLTGKNPATGGPAKSSYGPFHNLVGTMLAQSIGGTPEARIASRALGLDQPNANDPHTMFTPTGRPKKATQHQIAQSTSVMLANFLGLPVRNIDLKTARANQAKAHPNTSFHVAKKRGKKPSTTPAPIFGG